MLIFSEVYRKLMVGVCLTIPEGAVRQGANVDIFLAVLRDDTDRPKLSGLYLQRIFLLYIGLRLIRVFNRPEFSGRHDFQAKTFGRQCTKSGSQAVGLQEKSSKNLMQNKTYYICVTTNIGRGFYALQPC